MQLKVALFPHLEVETQARRPTPVIFPPPRFPHSFSGKTENVLSSLCVHMNASVTMDVRRFFSETLHLS